MSLLRFTLHRIRHYWQLLATLIVGVMLATALLATGPILVDTVVAFGLRRTLIRIEPVDANVRIEGLQRGAAVSRPELDEAVEELADVRFGTVLRGVVPAGGSQYLFPWPDGDVIPEERVNIRFYDESVEALNQHIEFVAGGWPSSPALSNDEIAVVISDGFAQAYNLSIDETLPLSFRNNDSEPAIFLRIAGIIRATNSQDRYWFGRLSPLRSHGDERYDNQYGALVDPAQFEAVTASYLPDKTNTLIWHLLLDPDKIAPTRLPNLSANLTQMDVDIDGWNVGLRSESGLLETIDEFTSQSSTVSAPLYFLSATIVLLSLYYVIMTASLSLRQRQREFAVMRSRGASTWQLFRLQMLEAYIIAALAIVAGPGLGWVLVSLLARYGPLADVAQSNWAIALPAAAWLAAIVGGISTVVALLGPVPAALQRSIVAHQQSNTRAGPAPFWQRFYLDIVITIIGLVLLWRVRLGGGIVGNAGETAQIDWLLLIAPLALLLGAATILLRVFPLVLQAGAELASKSRGLTAVLTLWQAARDPRHLARLVLLLTLAMSLGIFASGLNAALDANEADSSIYAAGSDLRLLAPNPNAVDAIGNLEGVEESTTALRLKGTLQQRIGTSNPGFDVYAIEPEAFASLASFRADFATQPVDQLLNNLIVDQTPPLDTILIEGRPERIGLWLWLHESDVAQLNSFDFDAKLVTAQRSNLTIHLNLPSFDPNPTGNWHYFDGAIPELPESSYPLALQSVWVRTRANFFSSSHGLIIDDISVTDANGDNSQLIDSFETTELDWWSSGDPFSLIRQTDFTYSGDYAMKLNLDHFGMRSWRWSTMNITGEPPSTPLPALVSRSFLDTSNLMVGDEVGTWLGPIRVAFTVVGVIDYFPTMYEEEAGGYLITLQAPMLDRMNQMREISTNSNELLISTNTATLTALALEQQAPALFTGNSDTLEAEEIRKTIKSDPLALGLRSMTLFGYLITTILSLAGFGTHFYLSARQRATSYGVLRAIGMAPRQLYATLLYEQLILIVSGLLLGTLLGWLLNWLTLSELPLSLGGLPAAPPFLAQTDWGAIFTVYATLISAFLISLSMVTAMLWRTRLHEALRVGEE